MNAVTNAELDTFYGVEATQYERTQAINKHVFAFDDDDLMNIVSEKFEAIHDALKDGDLLEVGHIIQQERRELIASRASHAVYGRGGVITSSMVAV